MIYRLLPRAIERQYQIWDYTPDSWGLKQADTYIRNLHQTIERAYDNRAIWRRVQGFDQVYFIRHEHHRIFFRELDHGVLGVITILHENMDLPARLKDDVGEGR